jgi:hypothetical protein
MKRINKKIKILRSILYRTAVFSTVLVFAFSPLIEPISQRLPQRVAENLETKTAEAVGDADVSIFILVASGSSNYGGQGTNQYGGIWDVPDDWNSASNSIEVIGAGGGGADGGGSAGGNGGGGGGYAKISNITFATASISAGIPFSVGASGSGAVNAKGTNGGHTWFGKPTFLACNNNSTTGGGLSFCVSAEGGEGGALSNLTASASGGGYVFGGSIAASSSGTIEYQGGSSGGAVGGTTPDANTGGGGAAGPGGTGKPGGKVTGTTGIGGGGGGGGGGGASTKGAIGTSTVGGAGGGGYTAGTGGGTGGTGNGQAGQQPGAGGGGGGDTTAFAGGGGANGTQWAGIYGSGGGGGGSGDGAGVGGNGGDFGGGAGGGQSCTSTTCRGGDGIIHIRYDPVASITISGTCKQNNETTDCTDAGVNHIIRYAINGTLKNNIQKTVAGTWTISGVATPASGDIITVFIEGEAASSSQAVAVTKYSGSGNIASMELMEGHLTIGSDQNTTITNANLALYDSSVSNKRIFYDVNGTTLNVDADNKVAKDEINVRTGDTYQPNSGGGDTINVGKVEYLGNLTLDSNTVNASSSWDKNGSGLLTAGTSTVVMSSASAVVDPGSGGFNNLTINVSGATNVTASGSFTIAGTLNIGSGDTFTIPSGLTVTHSGATLTLTGAIAGTGTLTMSNTAGTISGGGSAVNLTINPSSTGTVTLNSALTVSGVLTIASGDKFKIATGNTLTLSGTGTPLVATGTFEPNSGSTVQYTGTSANVTATTFGNLTLGGTGTYTLPAANTTINGNLTITLNATVASGSGTLLFSEGGTQSITDNTTNKMNLGEIAVRASTSGNTLLTLGSSIRIASVSVDASQALDLNGANTLTIQGSDSGSGKPFNINGTFIPQTTGTVQYTGGSATVGAATYNHLILGGTGTYTLPASDLTLRGNMTVTTGATVTKSATNKIVFAIGGGSSQTLTGNATNSDLGEIQVSANGGNTTLTLGSSVKISSASIDASQTLDTNGSKTLTITGIGTPLLASGSYGSLTTSNSTIVFTGNGSTNIPTLDYYNLKVQPSANSATHTFLSGTASISNTFTVGNGTNTGVTVTADTNNSGLDMASVSISANTTLTADGSSEFTLSRHFINNGSFTNSSGTITFEGPNTASISGATTFHHLTVTTPNKKLKFQAGTIFTFDSGGVFTVTGADSNNIKIESTASASQWLPHFTSAQSAVTYATITDSGCDTGSEAVNLDATSTNGGNNDVSCWVFFTPAITFNQTTYQWYENADNVQPGTALAAENMSTLLEGKNDIARLRMNLAVGSSNLSIGAQAFSLQVAPTTAGPWTSVGAESASFRFYNNSGASDGSDLANSILSDSTNAARATYQESNPSPVNPRAANVADKIEYDWSLRPSGQSTLGSTYYFRMVKSAGDTISYTNYPAIIIGKSPGSGGSGASGDGSSNPSDIVRSGGISNQTSEAPGLENTPAPGSVESGGIGNQGGGGGGGSPILFDLWWLLFFLPYGLYGIMMTRKKDADCS